MKRLGFPLVILALHGPAAAENDELLLSPAEATALVAMDPTVAGQQGIEKARQLDLQALSQTLEHFPEGTGPSEPGGTGGMIVGTGGPREVQGAASIGFIGRTDANSDSFSLIGSEQADGVRLVITDVSSLTAHEIPMAEEFRVIASVTVDGQAYALLNVSANAGSQYGLWKIGSSGAEKLIGFKESDQALDITVFPNGDLAVLVSSAEVDGSSFHPKLLRIAQDGKIIWKSRFTTTLSQFGSEASAYGVVSIPGEDAMLLVGTIFVPWIMKVAGDGLPLWEKSYLSNTITGAFHDGDGSDGFALVGQVHMGAEDDPEALVARVTSEGELIWIRGCGGMAYDAAHSATFTAEGGILVTGATKSKERASRGDLETSPWIMGFDADGWLVWETEIGIGGAAVAAWGAFSGPFAATDRRRVANFVLAPSFNGGELNWDVPEIYPFVPKNQTHPGLLSEGAATCFDIAAQIKLAMEAVLEPNFTATLRDMRLRGD